jgi:hypothetical protein
MLSPSAQTNFSTISTMTASRSGVRAPSARKGRLPLRNSTLQFLETNNIRSVEDRIAYEANIHNNPVIDQIKMLYPEQWNAMEGTESKIRTKVRNIMNDQFRKNKIVIKQLIGIVAEHASNNTEQQPEIVVEPEQEVVVVQEEIEVNNGVNEVVLPDAIPEITPDKNIQEVADGMIARLEYAAEIASSRTLSNIDDRTQELNTQMITSYRELTSELKDTIHSYKKKIAKMMDAKILELDHVVVTIEHRVEVPTPACISISGVVSTVAVFATLGFFMFI